MNRLFSKFTTTCHQYRSFIASSMLLLLLSATALPSMAAFCSLRDPITAIHSLYPTSTQHRSVVKPITLQIRQQVSDRLPFTIHYKEIGKHTLYLAMAGDQPLGIVQARSELSSWGIIELAWAINADLTVHDMVFQRCRSPECNDELRSEAQMALNGKSFDDILRLITEDGLDFSPEGKKLFPDAKQLHLTIVHSALKTLAVTELAWKDIMFNLQHQYLSPIPDSGTNP